jgi:hypothetical protein
MSQTVELTQSPLIPSFIRQSIYVGTGVVAGSSGIACDVAWNKLYSPKEYKIGAFLRANCATQLGRAAVRFWTFDQIRRTLQGNAYMPIWVIGGTSGAIAGFTEVLAEKLWQRTKPNPIILAKTFTAFFAGFGTFTYLSRTLSEEMPPQPFWYCWLMGTCAGLSATVVFATFDRIRPMQLIKSGILPKNMLVIGTTISVQVTGCAEVEKIAKGYGLL